MLKQLTGAQAPMITLLLFSTAMLVLPLGTYFSIHYFIKSTTVSAMGAIVMVQLIVAIYIYKAWHDETKEHAELLDSKVKAKTKTKLKTS